METRKIIIVITAILLTAGFFMPWVKFNGGYTSVSAWDMLFGQVREYIDTPLKYFAILIPLVATGILIYMGLNNQKHQLPQRLWFTLPIVSFFITAFSLIHLINQFGTISMILNDSEFSLLFRIFDLGFYVTLIASIVLLFSHKQAQIG